MTKAHISLLGFTFMFCFLHQPNWVYENFWSKADFYAAIPFVVPYLVFISSYAATTTVLAELGIRFIKKYT